MDNSLRILFVTGPYPPAVRSGGPTESVSGLAKALADRGHLVRVAASAMDAGELMEVPLEQEVMSNGVRVTYFRPSNPSGGTWGTFSLGPGFRRFLPKVLGESDWVDLQLGLMLDAPFVRRACRRLGVDYGYHQRGNLDPRRGGPRGWLKQGYIRFCERLVLQDAALLFALSEREALVYRAWVPNASVARVPNGVSVGEWQIPTTAEAVLKAELPEYPDVPLVLWMSRWDARKGWETALRAMAGALREVPEARGFMAGPGPETLRKRAEILREELGMTDRIIIREEVSGSDRRALLQRADVYLLPTAGEGLSMGVLEAMACGCAVVTTPEANMPELEAQGAGRIVPGTVDVFRKEICGLLTDAVLRLRMADKARSLAVSDFDWSQVAETYERNVITALSL
jgi:glycosyltransferase involved in cell wall biosynthesis